MAFANFIPELWEGRLQRQLRKSLVYGGICNRDHEQKLLVNGDRVRITSIGPPTIGDYVKGVTDVQPQQLSDASQFLDIERSKYFCFEVEDIDSAQAAGEILPEATDLAAYGFADALDQYIASKYTGAASITAATPINSLNVYDQLLALGQVLTEQNVPRERRWCIVPPWFVRKLSLAEVLVENIQGQAFATGWVGRCAGFDILESNNVPITNGTDYKVMAGFSTISMTLAEQINKTEPFRPPNAFSDALKGLHVYGAKVKEPAGLAVLDAQYLAEPV